VGGLRVAVVALCALVFVPAAFGGGPSMLVGAVEDAPKSTDAGQAKAKMDLAKLAGYDSIRVTQMWTRGQAAPAPAEIQALQNVSNAAALDGMRMIVAIHPQDSNATPTTPEWRAQFASYAAAVAQGVGGVSDFVIGNEPNINYYWMPQFAADGSDRAAADYEDTLARTYDAIKAVRPSARVMGGALSPRGNDAPGARPTHSPTQFIKDVGAVYRASGRAAPIMDALVLHGYGESSSIPPSFDHQSTTPIGIADYGKVVSLLAATFDGTGQPGSTLPILYGEYGTETTIPSAKEGLYTGSEPSSTRPVDEATQAAYYREAMKLAYCQANTIGLMIFHVTDESALAGLQSGPYYADDTPKSSLDAIRTAMNDVHAGTITSCPDQTAPTAVLGAPAADVLVGGPNGSVSLSATASDDVGVNRVEFLANGNVITSKSIPPLYNFVWSTASMASGSYAVQARALDGVRNAGLSGAVTITIDNTGPETTVTPQAAGSTDSQTFQFSASEAATPFECALDGAAFAPCTSPASYTALAPGQHTFRVRAYDSFGNVDRTPATYTWTAVDTTKPDTTITGAPTGTQPSNTATVTFTATEAASFECAPDGAAFAACASPVTLSGLADGSHTVQVRAIDTAGNVDETPATATWKVDTTAPDTSITAGPAGSTTSASASFSFTSTEPGTLECALDGSTFAACASPKAYSGLAVGSHTFQVRGRDPVGNVDGSPASRTWTISKSGPAGDMFAASQALTGSSGKATGSNAGATLEAGEPVHAGVSNGASIWWVWTAPASRSFTFDTAGSGFDTILAVYRGSAVNGLTKVAANDDVSSSSRTSKVTFSATSGTVYRIAVAGYAAATGSVVLNWK
jgi:hypothetical protein